LRSKILFLIFSLLSTLSAAFAAELHIKVEDPHSAAVSGAQVSLYSKDGATPLQVRTTFGDGEAVFHIDTNAGLRVQVLAPGFAPAWADVKTSPVLVTLQVSAASETVVVTATRTLVPEEESGGSVSLLSGEQIETMQPTSLADALRFLPGAVVNVAGQRGGLGSLFVGGGDSRYNKVLVDGVPINDPGGTFDFSTLPLAETDRVEFLHGAQSTLYGSDAMTSVVEAFSRNGTTTVPELRFGADGGTFGTAHGYVALSGARSRFDYDAFADQFNTNGQGTNADYTNALQGGNLGVQLSDRALFRLRARHSNSRTGVPGEWDFNGDRLFAPDADQLARANNFLSSAEFLITGPSHWQHRVTGYEYNTRRLNEDTVSDRDCLGPPFDCPFDATAHLNRAGFNYQGDYRPRSWAQTTVGYEFEDETGHLFSGSAGFPPSYTAALRISNSAYVEQRLTWKRLTALAGVRYIHQGASGRDGIPPGPSTTAPGINKAAPRVALTLLARKGDDVLSATRLSFSYAEGIKEARFEEEYAGPPFSIPNPNLQPEQTRAFEAGFEQDFLGKRFTVSANYFNNLFHDQINYVIVDFVNFIGQYQNVNRSMAHGAETRLAARVSSRVSLEGSYTYISSQFLTGSSIGQPLLRRPKHSGNLLLNYLGSRWGANLGGSFVGRRSDSDFLGFNIDHAAGYARVDLGGWYAINSRVTAYANVENALNDHYNEVVGYPALTANVRAGLRFRIGGE
jgi:outer membrane cobalamin receptor